MDTTNVTRTRIRRTLRQMANNRSPITEQRRIADIADALAHEQGEYTRLGEEVGIVGAESSLEREGMVIRLFAFEGVGVVGGVGRVVAG